MANYSFTDPAEHFENNDVIDTGNFSQLVPNTEIMASLTLTINSGNFTNVKKQASWTVNGGNWTQKSFCSHLHPELVAFGLSECVLECSHMKSKDEVYVDSILIETLYTYEDTGVSV